MEVGKEGVSEIEVRGVDEGVGEDVVGERIEVEAMEADTGENEKGEVGAAGDGVANDESMVKSRNEGVLSSVREVAEQAMDDGGEAATREDAEDGVKDGDGMAVVTLPSGPVEELET